MSDETFITADLVQQLITNQYPRYAKLPITKVEPGGWDNRIFWLGDDLLVRLPSADHYAPQITKEAEWLPWLAPRLPLAIPEPAALGKPCNDFPYPWAIYRWLDGGTPLESETARSQAFAAQLGGFLHALHRLEPKDGPEAGPHNFHRGGELAIYDAQTRTALHQLEDTVNTADLSEIWQQALTSQHQGQPQWLHGDMHPGNLLMQHGELHAVIDFGLCAIGDPACDLVMRWTWFTGNARQLFIDAVQADQQNWHRAAGWALWKAAISLIDPAQEENYPPAWAKRTLQRLTEDVGL